MEHSDPLTVQLPDHLGEERGRPAPIPRRTDRGTGAAKARRIERADSHPCDAGRAFLWRRQTQGKFSQVRLSEMVTNRANLKQCRGDRPTSTIVFSRPASLDECRDGCMDGGRTSQNALLCPRHHLSQSVSLGSGSRGENWMQPLRLFINLKPGEF